MEGGSQENALKRIESALARLETAASRQSESISELSRRHELLKQAASQTLSDLDALIASQRS